MRGTARTLDGLAIIDSQSVKGTEYTTSQHKAPEVDCAALLPAADSSVPRDHWLEDWERAAIIEFHGRYPLEGYRCLTFMMLDQSEVAVSSSRTYRVFVNVMRAISNCVDNIRSCAQVSCVTLCAASKGHVYAEPVHVLMNASIVRAIIALLVTLSSSALAGTLRVEMMDVGQGDAILVRTPADKIVLIDAGDDPHQVLALLKARKVDHLDLVVASHPHADHIGGMLDVVSSIPVKLYSDNGLPHTSATYRHLMETIEQRKIAYRAGLAGTTYRLDDGATLEILFPTGAPLRGTRSDLNANSVVVRLRHQGHCFLFLGDSEEPTERALLGADIGSCDVLKVAHHGSDYSSTAAFIQQVKPTIALISVGTGNSYGHPGPTTLARLDDIGAKIYRTDLFGAVTILSSEGALDVQMERSAAAQRVLEAAPVVEKKKRGRAVQPKVEATPASTAACPFLASADGKVFHEASCGIGHKISPKRLRCYPSQEAALAAGKRSAGCCEP